MPLCVLPGGVLNVLRDGSYKPIVNHANDR